MSSAEVGERAGAGVIHPVIGLCTLGTGVEEKPVFRAKNRGWVDSRYSLYIIRVVY